MASVGRPRGFGSNPPTRSGRAGGLPQGEVESSYDHLIFGLVIGGSEAEPKGVLRIYPVWRGQDQSGTSSLGVSNPVD